MIPMSEVDLSVTGALARIHLNRPKALNALTLEQIRAITPVMLRWRDDPGIAAVLITGEGERAFCAGGDIRHLYESGKRGEWSFNETYYREEYRLNRLIHDYPKPYVALIDGITMGGGAGLSVHGSFRVATPRTLFAMPETAIGFFPDVGATWYLSRCPGEIAMYLALSGARLKAADLLHAGLATHHVGIDAIPGLVSALEALPAASRHPAVKTLLDEFRSDAGPSELAARQAMIDRCFGADGIEAIRAALAAESDPWGAETLALLDRMSPFSLRFVYRQMRLGKTMDIGACLRLEFRMGVRFQEGSDFLEGVRSVIIDKDNKPAWRHALAEIPQSVADEWFASPPTAREEMGE